MHSESQERSEEGSDSEEEGFRLLLGGISTSDLASSAAWEAKGGNEVKTDSPEAQAKPISSQHGKQRNPPAIHLLASSGTEAPLPTTCNDTNKNEIFSNAFHMSVDGRCVNPPLVITDMSSVNNRGNGLVASRFIREGEIIYTEKASVATQIPSRYPSHRCFRVRGCQCCFRSLEPVSSCTLQSTDARGKDLTLPFPHLWPVPEYKGYQPLDLQKKTPYLKDDYGRIHCKECGVLFCSINCRDAHNRALGTCCDFMAAIQAVAHASCKINSNALSDTEQESANETSGVSDLILESEIDPSVFVATRVLCMEVQMHRTTGENENANSPVRGMCGDPENVTSLEIGWMHRKTSSHYVYTLEPAYDAVSTAMQLTPTERQLFPLKYFHRLAAVAARNSFEVATQSPFKLYYSSLMRAVGGRGTDQHTDAMKRIAMVLGSENGTLCRDMDEQISERCVVKAACLFKLTARVNHSCDPCAEVRQQQFVDCNVDLVATRDILCGQEISISYMNFGRMCGRAHDTAKRRRELQARYLFICDCNRCTGND